jgi:hypothetical protein
VHSTGACGDSPAREIESGRIERERDRERGESGDSFVSKREIEMLRVFPLCFVSIIKK